MRKFEKITFKQFKNDINNDKILYEEYHLPKRSTKFSAGYDICSLIDCSLEPGSVIKIPTGAKIMMNCDEMFMIIPRSSLGTKYGIVLSNGVGLIDADYYNNETNEGHFFISLRNTGNENFEIHVGDKIAQGLFIKYLCVDDEEEINENRKGGFGSTNKEKK